MNYDDYKLDNPFDKENPCELCGEPCENEICEDCVNNLNS